MNKTRRNVVRDLIARLEAIAAEINEIKDQEQTYFDNMPEAIQDGERGEAAENAISALEDALSSIDEVAGSLQEAIGE